MGKNESREERRGRVASELGAALRRQAAGSWGRVRTAERHEDRGHAWRFQPGPSAPARFLRVTNEALDEARDSAAGLLSHLDAGRWLARLEDGPETCLVLHRGGRLQARPVN